MDKKFDKNIKELIESNKIIETKVTENTKSIETAINNHLRVNFYHWRAKLHQWRARIAI